MSPCTFIVSEHRKGSVNILAIFLVPSNFQFVTVSAQSVSSLHFPH